METLVTKSSADLVEMIIDAAKAQQSWAVKCAKGIVALVTVTGSEEVARATLKKAKLADCHVKNAMQLVWAYDAVVRPKHADESWFDSLLYIHAVTVRQAIAKVGVKKLAEWKLFEKSAKANLIEFELIAETGLNRSERIAKAEADALKAVEAEKRKADKAKETAEKEAAPAVPTLPPAPTTPETSAAEIVIPATAQVPADPAQVLALVTPKPGKGKKPVVDEFDSIIGAAEKFVGAVFPTADDLTVELIKNRVAALMVIIEQKAEERAKNAA